MTDKKTIHIVSVSVFAALLLALFLPLGESGRIVAAILLLPAAVFVPLLIKKSADDPDGYCAGLRDAVLSLGTEIWILSQSVQAQLQYSFEVYPADCRHYCMHRDHQSRDNGAAKQACKDVLLFCLCGSRYVDRFQYPIRNLF